MNISVDTVLYGENPQTTEIVFRNELTIGYIFINTGNVPAVLNNFVLFPGCTYKTFEGNLIDKTTWKLSFLTTNTVYSSCSLQKCALTALIYNELKR